MKKVLLLAATLMLAATVVHAESVTYQGGQKYRTNDATPIGYYDTDSTFRAVGGVTPYPLPIKESSPSREVYRHNSSADLTTTLAIGGVDSIFTPIDLHQYRHLILLCEFQGAGLSRLAGQLRFHLNAGVDSSSVFPWVSVNPATGTVALGDTATSITAAPTATTPGGDEFQVDLQHTLWAGSTVPGMTGRRVLDLGMVPTWCQYATLRVRLLGRGPGPQTSTVFRFWLVATAL